MITRLCFVWRFGARNGMFATKRNMKKALIMTDLVDGNTCHMTCNSQSSQLYPVRRRSLARTPVCFDASTRSGREGCSDSSYEEQVCRKRLDSDGMISKRVFRCCKSGKGASLASQM